MSYKTEAVVSRDTKKHQWDNGLKEWVEVDPFLVYFLIPSPALGVRSKNGSKIANTEGDPIWQDLEKLADSGARALVETREPVRGLEAVTILGFSVIEEPRS